MISLCPVQRNKFAYSLINGEVGVYGMGGTRVWRTKVRAMDGGQRRCVGLEDKGEGDGW